MNFQALEAVLGYEFQDKKRLEKALTHPSLSRLKAVGEKVFNYERLEFLGDGVLGLVVAELLFSHFLDENEGDLAKRHAALVRGETVTQIALELGLGQFMLMADGEEQTGGRENASNLENTLEALIGAMYVDGGLEVVKSFILKNWTPKAIAMKRPPKDPKTALQEWAQARKLPIPEYVAIKAEGPAHSPMFTIEVTVKGQAPVQASGTSKKIAEKKAASLLVELLEEKENG